MQQTQTIFISYSWEDITTVDIIDSDFKSIGINIIRDIRDLQYKESIKEFMSKVRFADHSLIIISDSYLKSRNCMYEILEISKDANYHDKILPLIIDGCNIFKAEDKISYVNYWIEQGKNLRELLQGINPIKAIPLIEELKVIEQISLEIADFLSLLSQIKLKSVLEVKVNKYDEILKLIGLENDTIKRQLLSVSSIEDESERDLFIEQLTIKYPHSADVAFKRAYIELNEKKNIRKASILWKDYIDKFEERDAAYNNLGLALTGLNQKEESETAYLKAIAINPQSAETYHNLGILYWGLFKNYPKAIESLEKAIELNIEFATTYSLLAFLYRTVENKFDEAIKLFERAIAINPSIREPYYNLMDLAISHLKDKNKALIYAKLAIEYNPNDAISFSNLGLLYQREFNDYLKAKEYFRLAIVKDPNYTEAYLNLSNLEAAKLGNTSRAIEILEDILMKEPDNVDALFNLALLLSVFPDCKDRSKNLYLAATENRQDMRNNVLDLMFGI